MVELSSDIIDLILSRFFGGIFFSCIVIRLTFNELAYSWCLCVSWSNFMLNYKQAKLTLVCLCCLAIHWRETSLVTNSVKADTVFYSRGECRMINEIVKNKVYVFQFTSLLRRKFNTHVIKSYMYCIPRILPVSYWSFLESIFINWWAGWDLVGHLSAMGISYGQAYWRNWSILENMDLLYPQ